MVTVEEAAAAATAQLFWIPLEAKCFFVCEINP
jgi:hypothetical protein